ncbi:unnamed protein product [Fusarium equiseti]|uniref:Uncharacterized protein n=1 Tax=Fusarium equiseti TaxID=61235 RepID=A0A8J2II26_FUSEQ|nr:unnamed protein product [Fusarium equiseti]
MSPPSDEPDCQNTSFDDAQTKVETTEQTPGELQARHRSVPEQRQQHKASTIQLADSNGEEKKFPDLNIEDLPLRSNEVWDRSSAISLCTLFNQHQASMPSRVRLKLLHLLKTGQFRHNDQSIRSPLKHQLSLQMYDENAGEPKWINATYERWFILVGIYGFATLRNKASGLWQAIIMRYGERLDTELAFKKSPDETGSLLRPFLSQLGEEVSMWTPTIQQHEYMLRQHEQTIRTQSAMIQQLREANSNQQKQIDQLKAIVGVQFRTGPPENMTGRDNNINQNVKIPNTDIGSDESSLQPSEMPSKRARHN